nr:hypothetical protein [Blattabacterium clevelandi]
MQYNYLKVILMNVFFLPDKSIDLINEAASKIRMEINSQTEKLDIRKIM